MKSPIRKELERLEMIPIQKEEKGEENEKALFIKSCCKFNDCFMFIYF